MEERLPECICVISAHWGIQPMCFAPVSVPEENIQVNTYNSQDLSEGPNLYLSLLLLYVLSSVIYQVHLGKI